MKNWIVYKIDGKVKVVEDNHDDARAKVERDGGKVVCLPLAKQASDARDYYLSLIVGV